jgi:transcriptional regulator with XRE-family HTH domain
MTKTAELVQFGQAVRDFRKSAGISQEDLADRADIHRTYIGGIERGERNPTLLMIVRIAKALEISVARLLKEADRRLMRAVQKWNKLGWKHPLWDLIRYYLSLRGSRQQSEFRRALRDDKHVLVNGDVRFPVGKKVSSRLFERYLEDRRDQFASLVNCLRTEEQALEYCKQLGITAQQTTTQRDHHQSSKAMVAAVSAIAQTVCAESNSTVDTNPQTRCVWCFGNFLHVSVRNIDGAVPGLFNPTVIWEIKEYWGKTSGGSKMSDAVYECHLLGMEIRRFEEKSQQKVQHVVFVDGRDQWSVRQSDLNRFIDLLNQGLIDYLFVGSMVETEWRATLKELISIETGK